MDCFRSLLLLTGLVSLPALATAAPYRSEARLGAATMSFDGRTLRVSTGAMERDWRLTPGGLTTVGLSAASAGSALPLREASRACDWSLPGIIAAGEPGQLVSLDAATSDDEGFTGAHLSIEATFHYPSSAATVRYVIWAYPNAPGLRTQLWIEGKPPGAPTAAAPGAVDCLPLALGAYSRRYFGYYNNTQRRDEWSLPILREITEPPAAPLPESVDWASGADFERPGTGVMLIKESHKCVNQAGVETGAFDATEDGIANTGLRLKPADLKPDRFRWAWASWCLVYDGTDGGRELALKRFYALRFPIDPTRDVYAQANTWGSGGYRGINSRDQARESQVLPEIDSVADLGLDSLQIDDGWQAMDERRKTQTWRPDPARYPDGWRRVAARAAERHVGISLWAPSTVIPLADMEWNYEQLHVRSWKLDFTRLTTADAIDANLDKVRRYVAFTGHRSSIAWDLTENAPRYGYYWARDVGGAWLANRKPGLPTNVVYKPDVLLRDLWQLARYVNLNKIQVPVQNVATVDRKLSDAWRYDNLYAVAIGLTGVPCFFETTRFYSEADRARIRTLIAEWKRHRVAMAEDTLFPIGDPPSPGSWAAFQFVDADRRGGYFLIFRDASSGEATREIPLRFVTGGTLAVEDLRTQVEETIPVDSGGRAHFRIDRPAGFLFAHYRIAGL